MGPATKFQLTYNLQREFPFQPWFRWFVAVGFFALFALFTVFNIATTGYDMQSRATNDPNTTMAQRNWFDSPVLTFGDSKLKPSCEARPLSVGDYFFSSNRGFTYIITALSTHPHSNPQPSPQTSISYLNNTLERCRVNSVVVNARKSDTSQPASTIGGGPKWWSWVTSNAAAISQCDVVGPEVVSTIYFRADFAGISNNFDYVITADPKTRASVWWGTRLLNLAFTGIQAVMSQLTLGIPVLASMTYKSNHNTTFTDPYLFNVSYSFMDTDGNVKNDNDNGADPNFLYNNAATIFSPPMTEGWYFAKLFSSLILVDLGNTSQSNLLLNKTLLQMTLDPQDDFNRKGPSASLGINLTTNDALDWWKIRGISPPGTESNYYNAVDMTTAWDNQNFTSVLGPLGTKNATIDTQYVCSVPRRKGNASIALIIFLGNWVLLSSSWVLLKFISTQVVLAKDPNAMRCERCARDIAPGSVSTIEGDEEWHRLVSFPAESKSGKSDHKSLFKRSSRPLSTTSSLLNGDERTEVRSIV